MHLHGHNFWILAQGMGTWNGTIPNPINPTRRDTFIIDAGTPELPAYTVIEWAADNPGVWAFHCHISSHVSLGLNANIVVSRLIFDLRVYPIPTPYLSPQVAISIPHSLLYIIPPLYISHLSLWVLITRRNARTLLSV